MGVLSSFDPDDDARPSPGGGRSSFGGDWSAYEALRDVRALMRSEESEVLTRARSVVWTDERQDTLKVTLPFGVLDNDRTKAVIVPRLWEEHRQRADHPAEPYTPPPPVPLTGIPALIAVAAERDGGFVRVHTGPYGSTLVVAHAGDAIVRFIIVTEAAAQHPAAVTRSRPDATLIVPSGIAPEAFSQHPATVVVSTDAEVVLDGAPLPWTDVPFAVFTGPQQSAA